MQKKIPVNELRHGMFVAELDRPWLDTPFLLQGFLIDSDEQIRELQRLCSHVFIDPRMSTGKAHVPREKKAPPKPSPRVDPKNTTPQAIITNVASSSKAEEKKGSLIKDVRTIFKQTFSAENQPQARQGGEPALITRAYYVDDRERPALTDTHVQNPLGKNYTLTSRPTEDSGPIIYGSKTKELGFFKQLLRVLTRPTVKTPEAKQTTEPASYGEVELTKYEDVVPIEKELEQVRGTHEKSIQIFEDIVKDIRSDKILEVEKVNDAVSGMVDSIVRNPDALIWLSRLKQQNDYAYGHALDVSIYMIAFGRHLGFPKTQLNHLGMGGLLQDVGKIKLPQELLNKKGMLHPEEFSLLRSHVDYSMEVLSETKDMPLEVLDIVANHHERFDGSGYPRGLQDDQIGMLGTMAGIVDCFRAIVSERPYAAAISAHQAMQDLYDWRGKYFSGVLVEQFIQCLGIYPVGTLVELNTGDVAVVAGQNKVRKLKPQVLLILDPNKERYAKPTFLDLINNPVAFNNKPFEISRALPPGAYGIDPKEFYL